MFFLSSEMFLPVFLSRKNFKFWHLSDGISCSLYWLTDLFQLIWSKLPFSSYKHERLILWWSNIFRFDFSLDFHLMYIPKSTCFIFPEEDHTAFRLEQRRRFLFFEKRLSRCGDKSCPIFAFFAIYRIASTNTY